MRSRRLAPQDGGLYSSTFCTRARGALLFQQSASIKDEGNAMIAQPAVTMLPDAMLVTWKGPFTEGQSTIATGLLSRSEKIGW